MTINELVNEKRSLCMYIDNELVIRPVEERDLLRLWELIYKEDAPEWYK